MRNLILRAVNRFDPEVAFARMGNGPASARRFGRPACPPKGAESDDGMPDSVRFLLAWLRNPLGTAAIAPSSRALATLMARGVDATTGPVLELGPGTGVLTQSVLARGIAESDLTLVEQNPDFAALLTDRFPAANILTTDAAALERFRAAEDRAFGAVICGLGLRNMEADQVESILDACFRHMRPGGAFYLFTYGLRCSVPDEVLERLDLEAERVGMTLLNVPPATVYRVTARANPA